MFPWERKCPFNKRKNNNFGFGIDIVFSQK